MLRKIYDLLRDQFFWNIFLKGETSHCVEFGIGEEEQLRWLHDFAEKIGRIDPDILLRGEE